ncbi:DUF4124 domain-containing protein [Gammaproteobacteria bacterium]|nr:DUF4124 domain-containing protein [Gammaproteobacteria bacterium]
MRCHLLIKTPMCLLLCVGLQSWHGIAFAQVYKSYDANGNVIFSDKATKRSSEVEISKPNLSDSFDVPPPTESPPATKPKTVSKSEPVAQPEIDNDSADTNNDGRVSRREKEEQRKAQRKKRREAATADGEDEE